MISFIEGYCKVIEEFYKIFRKVVIKYKDYLYFGFLFVYLKYFVFILIIVFIILYFNLFFGIFFRRWVFLR